jgi:glycerol uptake facilitator-like aquaporin
MKSRIFIGEFIGSTFLVMIIVGSGIMAQNLTSDTAIMLLANTLATGAGLFVLISSIANISGAHFNPVVTMVMYFTRRIKKDLIFTYLGAQILGCLLGVMLANFMFDLPLIELSKKTRPGFNIYHIWFVKKWHHFCGCICCSLYYCWLLVYCINFFCKSCSCVS